MHVGVKTGTSEFDCKKTDMKLHQNLKIPTPMRPSQNQLSGASFGSEKYLRM